MLLSLLFVEEDGWCLDQYGCDPNGKEDGEILISYEYNITLTECLQKCFEIENATGCEASSKIVPIGTKKVYCRYHTKKLSKATGVKGYGCYIRDRGNLVILKLYFEI